MSPFGVFISGNLQLKWRTLSSTFFLLHFFKSFSEPEELLKLIWPMFVQFSPFSITIQEWQSQTCNPGENGTFPGTSLINCASLAPDITSCQAKGKIVTLSLGGAEGSFGFQSSSQATAFAHTIWNMFLGGSSATRPFGRAVLDGYALNVGILTFANLCIFPRIDLDFENGTLDYFATFVNTIRSLEKGADKQCVTT